MKNTCAALLALALGASLGPWAIAAAPAQESAMPTHHETAQATLSTVLTLTAGARTVTLSPADLQAMPQTTVTVFNAHTKQDETYSGPLVADVLARADIALTEHTQHGILDSYVTATGADGYFVVFSGAEVQPGLHKNQVIVALRQSGRLLTRTGAFQIIDPQDAKPARWVRNLTALRVNPVSAANSSMKP